VAAAARARPRRRRRAEVAAFHECVILKSRDRRLRFEVQTIGSERKNSLRWTQPRKQFASTSTPRSRSSPEVQESRFLHLRVAIFTSCTSAATARDRGRKLPQSCLKVASELPQSCLKLLVAARAQGAGAAGGSSWSPQAARGWRPFSSGFCGGRGQY
jgi:hypothetical protein